jgi:hypothetical protein
MTTWHYGFLVEEVVDAIAREYSWPDYLPKKSRTPRIDPKVFDSYVGVYELRPGVQVRVVRHGDRLGLELSGDALDLAHRWRARAAARVGPPQW